MLEVNFYNKKGRYRLISGQLTSTFVYSYVDEYLRLITLSRSEYNRDSANGKSIKNWENALRELERCTTTHAKFLWWEKADGIFFISVHLITPFHRAVRTQYIRIVF